LVRDLRKLASKLNVAASLQMYGHALKVGREGVEKGHHFYLMKLEPSNASMTITGFPRRSLEEATKRYLEVEREISGDAGSEAVLVSVDSLAVLQRAYPNYFLDTKIFLQELAEAIKKMTIPTIYRDGLTGEMAESFRRHDRNFRPYHQRQL
jgi:hypothetical protein